MGQIKYFLFSREQMEFRKIMEAKQGKKFKVGTVIINGVRKPYTEMSDSGKSRYSDANIVAHGDISKIKYTPPKGE